MATDRAWDEVLAAFNPQATSAERALYRYIRHHKLDTLGPGMTSKVSAIRGLRTWARTAGGDGYYTALKPCKDLVDRVWKELGIG